MRSERQQKCRLRTALQAFVKTLIFWEKWNPLNSVRRVTCPYIFKDRSSNLKGCWEKTVEGNARNSVGGEFKSRWQQQKWWEVAGFRTFFVGRHKHMQGLRERNEDDLGGFDLGNWIKLPSGGWRGLCVKQVWEGSWRFQFWTCWVGHVD